MEGHLKGLLIDTPKDSIMDGIIESVLVKEKLDEIYKALQNVVDGEIKVLHNRFCNRISVP